MIFGAGVTTLATKRFAEGIQMFFGIFLSWAIARELDPDNNFPAGMAAFVGGGLMTLGLSGDHVSGTASLGAVTAVLFAIRIVTRTTGLAPSLLDNIWIVGLCAYSASTKPGLLAAIGLALALGIDTVLEKPAPRMAIITAVLAILAAGYAYATPSATPGWRSWEASEIAILAVGVAATLGIRNLQPSSIADHTGETLFLSRLGAGRRLAAGLALAACVFSGGFGVSALSPLWAAAICVGISHWTRRSSPQSPVERDLSTLGDTGGDTGR